MASLSVTVSRLWASYVTGAVMTGWCIANINTQNTSLLYAWLVFLCDLVYITDVLTRTGKRVYRSIIAADLTLLFNCRSPFIIFDVAMTPFYILSIVPYHMLVIFELDESGAYNAACVLRAAVMLISGRFHVLSAFYKTRTSARQLAAQKRKGPVTPDALRQRL